MSECNCSVCRRHALLRDLLGRRNLTDADVLFLKNSFTQLLNAETDSEYWELKYKGKWPTRQAIVEQLANNSAYTTALKELLHNWDVSHKSMHTSHELIELVERIQRLNATHFA